MLDRASIPSQAPLKGREQSVTGNINTKMKLIKNVYYCPCSQDYSCEQPVVCLEMKKCVINIKN